MSTSTPGAQAPRVFNQPPDLRTVVARLTHIAFAAFLFLALTAPSWRIGPFTWWPVVCFPMLAGRPAELGLLSLLPGLIVAGWSVSRILGRPARPWRWGRPGIAWPLVGLTLLVLLGLDPALTWRTAVQIGGLSLFWLVYLFTLNENPDLTIPLALSILVQGSVAVGQFLRQRDLGLAFLGELPLDPQVSGVIVLYARGQRWLRAYGLTGHPNVLGATLAILLLLLLPALYRARGWRRAGLTFVASVGLLGLLISFSRASWLAFGVGVSVWAIQAVRYKLRVVDAERGVGARPPLSPSRLPLQFVVPFVLVALFLFLYRDLVVSRFIGLDTPIEARSLNDRRRDADLALELIATHPWRGVGTGNYLPAVRAFEPDSRSVHNVLLLVTAELGLPGAALWLWLTAAGLWMARVVPAEGRSTDGRLAAGLGPWLATVVVGLFDVSLWMTTSWRAAILFGVVAACVAGGRIYECTNVRMYERGPRSSGSAGRGPLARSNYAMERS